MKTRYLLPIITGLTLGGIASAGTLAEKLEQGIQFQETEGNLKKAIQSFQDVTRKGEKSQKYAAEAHYRLAECYFELGDSENAESELNKLLNKYPEGNKWVKKAAQLKSPAVQFIDTPFSPDGEYHGYDVILPNGKTIGNLYSAIISTTHNGEPVWQSFFGRSAGMVSVSHCIFTKNEKLNPINSECYFQNFGTTNVSYNEDHSYVAKNLSTGKELDKQVAPTAGSVVYGNDQVVPILRLFPYEIGKTHSIYFRNPMDGNPYPLKLTATEELEVEVPAGKFQCYKIESNINQTFYISTDESRQLVRMDLPGAKAVLRWIEDYDVTQGHELESKNFPVSFKLPAGSFYYPASDNNNRYRLRFDIGGMSILEGMLEIKPIENLPPEAQKNTEAFSETISQIMSKSSDAYEILEETREIKTINDVHYAIFQANRTAGAVKTAIWHAYGLNEKYGVRFRCNFAPQADRSQAAKEKLMHVINSIKFN